MCRLRHIVAVTLFWGLQSQVLWAWEGSYSLSAGLQNNDNVSLSSTKATNSVQTDLGLQFDYSHDSASLSSGVQGSFANRTYSRDEFDVDNIVDATAFADFAIVPGTFHWYGSAFATQTLVDIFSADTPQNRTDIKRYTTGPNFIFRFSDVTNLTYQYRYQVDQVGDALLPDTISTRNSLVLSRRLGPLTSINLTGSQNSTYLDDGGDDDLKTDTVNASVGMRRQFKSAVLNISGGETEITLPNGDSSKGGSANSRLDYSITPQSGITVSYNQNIYDSSVDLLSQFRSIIEDLPVVIERSVYQDKTLLFQLKRSIFDANVTLTWSNTDHNSLESLVIVADNESDLPLSGDSQSELVRLGVSDVVGKASHSFALSQLMFSERAEGEEIETETFVASYQLNYQFTSNFVSQFSLQRTSRDDNRVTSTANANIIGVSIIFTY